MVFSLRILIIYFFLGVFLLSGCHVRARGLIQIVLQRAFLVVIIHVNVIAECSKGVENRG